MSNVLQEPKILVESYYKALYTGDLVYIKKIMTPRSYIMMLESFGLKHALEDPSFKKALERVEKEADALAQVEETLSVDLKSRHISPDIEIVKVEPNGDKRETVYYTEDGKNKRLYFSKEDDGWQINYFAGRPVSSSTESYFVRLKKKIISILKYSE